MQSAPQSVSNRVSTKVSIRRSKRAPRTNATLSPSLSAFQTPRPSTVSQPKAQRARRADKLCDVVPNNSPVSRPSTDQARSMSQAQALPDVEIRQRRIRDSHCPTQPTRSSLPRALHKSPTTETHRRAPMRPDDRTNNCCPAIATHRSANHCRPAPPVFARRFARRSMRAP